MSELIQGVWNPAFRSGEFIVLEKNYEGFGL